MAYTVYVILARSTPRRLANLSKLSFETVVLKGLAADGGLFLPEEIPVVNDWVSLHRVNHSYRHACSMSKMHPRLSQPFRFGPLADSTD